jgi:hypothetical protein
MKVPFLNTVDEKKEEKKRRVKDADRLTPTGNSDKLTFSS